MGEYENSSGEELVEDVEQNNRRRLMLHQSLNFVALYGNFRLVEATSQAQIGCPTQHTLVV